jgi:hypothetical protein
MILLIASINNVAVLRANHTYHIFYCSCTNDRDVLSSRNKKTKGREWWSDP